MSHITVAVYSGSSGYNISQFRVEMDKRSSRSIIVEYVTNQTIRENKCGRFTTPNDFVDWLLSASVYFIVSQGFWLGLLTSNGKFRMSEEWTVASIEKASKRLAKEGRFGYHFSLFNHICLPLSFFCSLGIHLVRSLIALFGVATSSGT